MKLTKAQERAKAKLTLEWQSADQLGEHEAALDVLVERNVAEHVLLMDTGLMAAVETPGQMHYRLTQGRAPTQTGK